MAISRHMLQDRGRRVSDESGKLLRLLWSCFNLNYQNMLFIIFDFTYKLFNSRRINLWWDLKFHLLQPAGIDANDG
jgi:hypothetical protein